MTAAEHLDFFARLKGINGSQVKNEIETRLNYMGKKKT